MHWYGETDSVLGRVELGESETEGVLEVDADAD